MKEIYRLVKPTIILDILPPFLKHVDNTSAFHIISKKLDNKISFSRRRDYLEIHRYMYDYDNKHILISCSHQGYLAEVKIILESCDIEELSYNIVNAMFTAGLNYQKKTFLFLLRYVEKHNIAINKGRVRWWLGHSHKYLKYL